MKINCVIELTCGYKQAKVVDNWGQFVLIFPQKGQMVNLLQSCSCCDAGTEEFIEPSATSSQCVYLGPVHWQYSKTCTLVTTESFFPLTDQDGSVDTEASNFDVYMGTCNNYSRYSR